MLPATRCVILVPVGGPIDPDCEDALRELERRGYVVWRIRGYAAIDAARNQMANDAFAQGFEDYSFEITEAPPLEDGCDFGLVLESTAIAFPGRLSRDSQNLRGGSISDRRAVVAYASGSLDVANHLSPS